MKLKITRDCLMAKQPHEPHASFKAGEELDVDQAMADRLLSKGYATSAEENIKQVEVSTALDSEPAEEERESTEKSSDPDRENKSLLHNKKIKNK